MKHFNRILLVILALQCALWFSNLQPAIVESEVFSKPSLTIAGVDSVRIEMEEQHIDFIKDPKLSWCFDLGKGQIFPVRDRSMNPFLAHIFSYHPGPIRGSSAEKAKELQVDKNSPYARIVLKNKTDQKEFFIAPGPGESDYIRLKGDKAIYQLQPSLRWWLSVDKNNWIDNKLTSIEWDVQNITWQSHNRSAVRIGSSGLNWRSNGRLLNKKTVDAFVDEFSQLRIDEALSLKHHEGDLPFKKTCQLTFNSSTKPVQKVLTLYINADKVKNSKGQEGYQVMLKGDARLVFIKKARFKNLVELGPYVFTK